MLCTYTYTLRLDAIKNDSWHITESERTKKNSFCSSACFKGRTFVGFSSFDSDRYTSLTVYFDCVAAFFVYFWGCFYLTLCAPCHCHLRTEHRQYYIYIIVSWTCLVCILNQSGAHTLSLPQRYSRSFAHFTLFHSVDLCVSVCACAFVCVTLMHSLWFSFSTLDKNFLVAFSFAPADELSVFRISKTHRAFIWMYLFGCCSECDIVNMCIVIWI